MSAISPTLMQVGIAAGIAIGSMIMYNTIGSFNTSKPQPVMNEDDFEEEGFKQIGKWGICGWCLEWVWVGPKHNKEWYVKEWWLKKWTGKSQIHISALRLLF